MPVKSRRDKAPNLVQDDRRSQKNAAHQSDLQIQIEWICRAEVGQMGIHVVFLEYNQDWLFNKRVNLVLRKIPANAETYGYCRRRPDDALAQLFQMLHQAHGAHLPCQVFFAWASRFYCKFRHRNPAGWCSSCAHSGGSERPEWRGLHRPRSWRSPAPDVCGG